MARFLEPYRGFHQFMHALPEICQRQPDCHVLIEGGDDISYGKKLNKGLHYLEKLLKEIGLDQNHLHFLGKLS